MKRKKRRDPNSYSLLKEKAWNSFSKFVRARDCMATTGFPDAGNCITCGGVFPFKELQAGHFIPGRGNAVLFDERQVHAQCYRCNIKLKGNWVPYEAFMVEKYGRRIVEEMKVDARKTHQIMGYQLKELREHYDEEYRKILSQAGMTTV